MTVSKQQALTLDHFHYLRCSRTIGPRGGITEKTIAVRRSGRTQTWKTRPNDFRLPVKFGMYQSGAITNLNADNFHTLEDCPLRQSDLPLPVTKTYTLEIFAPAWPDKGIRVRVHSEDFESNRDILNPSMIATRTVQAFNIVEAKALARQFLRAHLIERADRERNAISGNPESRS